MKDITNLKNLTRDEMKLIVAGEGIPEHCNNYANQMCGDLSLGGNPSCYYSYYEDCIIGSVFPV